MTHGRSRSGGHIRADGLTERRPLLDLVAGWTAFLVADDAADLYQRLRAGERTGRPCAEAGLIDQLEATLGRRIHRRKPGPKPAHTTPAASARR